MLWCFESRKEVWKYESDGTIFLTVTSIVRKKHATALWLTYKMVVIQEFFPPHFNNHPACCKLIFQFASRNITCFTGLIKIFIATKYLYEVRLLLTTLLTFVFSKIITVPRSQLYTTAPTKCWDYILNPTKGTLRILGTGKFGFEKTTPQLTLHED